MKQIIVAIDGYSSSGKSTMAKHLARAAGYAYVDSGAMYRAVTLYAMRHGMIADDGTPDSNTLAQALPEIEITFQVRQAGEASRTCLNGEDVEDEIRSLAVSNHVSPIAALPEVRHRITALLRGFGHNKGIVMDGRDIGTTVFPDAEMKVFVDASPEIRARRRHEELTAKGKQADYGDVLKNILERDNIDKNRKVIPLQQAADAVVLCNDDMSIEEQHKWLMNLFKLRSTDDSAHRD